MKLLIVDDESSIRSNLSRHFARKGMEVFTADCGAAAVDACAASTMDVVLLDLRLPDTSGLEVLEKIKAGSPQPSVVVITAHGDVDTAVKAMQLKADHFLVKPVDLAALDAIVLRLFESSRRLTELSYLKDKVSRLSGYVGPSRCRLPSPVAETIRALASSPATSVLIQGETGTGKGVAARLIHELSARAPNAFVDLNCATLTPEFLESELFGHERGAFTDAKTFKRGLLELANGGTLFLDEIGELALPVQAKLLKVLEDRSFRRLGGTSLQHVDTRILAATNSDLQRAVRTGRFRADLFYRLNVMSLVVPPLRSRRDEILPLAHEFLAELGGAAPGQKPRGLAPAAEAALESYAWPGNIRELRNVVERALLLSRGGGVIGLEHLPDNVVPDGRVEIPAAAGDLSLESVEREHIAKVLRLCENGRSQAARLLGIHRSTLLQKIARFGL